MCLFLPLFLLISSQLVGFLYLFQIAIEINDDDVWTKSFRREEEYPMTIVLLRSIGNALPPRHQISQTLDNLNFTLTYEKSFPNVIKHWVLNRFVEKEVERQVVELLDQYRQNYTIIPFDLKEYSELKLDFDLFEPGGQLDYVHDIKYFRNDMDHKMFKQAIEVEKNLYVCNVNGARNKMIDIGLSMGATWILPWDGNCFITNYAFWYIQNQLAKEKGKYVVTPTHRVVGENSQILDSKYRREPSEEPMISFRKDAVGRFHPRLWYGRRDKVELLWRMNVSGPWDSWSNFSVWEQEKLLLPRLSSLTDSGGGNVSKVGWTYRLNSGNPHLEGSVNNSKRMLARTESVTLMFDKLDYRVVTELFGFSENSLLFYNESSLAEDRRLFKSKDPQISSLRAQLLQLADHSLSFGPWSVMDKPKSSCSLSNNCHDYYSWQPYVWILRGKEVKKTKYVWRDSVMLPATLFNGIASQRFDRTRLCYMQYNTTTLTLAYFMTGNMTYASHAAEAVRTWFIRNETRMNPHMQYARVYHWIANETESNDGIREMKDVYYFLDAVRILRQAGTLSDEDQLALHEWFTLYLFWLESSRKGRNEYTAPNNIGVYFDIQIVSVAAFVNDTKTMLWYLDRSVSRLKTQVNQSGAMPWELRRANCEHYQLVALQGWFTLARIGKIVGRNLWDAYPEIVDGMHLSALCRAAYYAIPFFRPREECPGNKRPENPRRWWPLWYEAQLNCPGLPTANGNGLSPLNSDSNGGEFLKPFKKPPPTSRFSMPSMFHPYDGIAPFWNLGLAGS